jgi:hypothetical protein
MFFLVPFTHLNGVGQMVGILVAFMVIGKSQERDLDPIL